jgi:hypothetical protein
METMIQNYINGNLKEARKQARRFTQNTIRHVLELDYGYSVHKASLVARWIKTGSGYQEACDAK